MSWTSPATATAGSILTAAWLNTYLRDNMNAVIQTTSTITTTGTSTALAIPSGHGDLVIFANNATLLTLQGITAGYDGQQLTLFSIGAGQVDFVNQSAGASAALRIINGVTGNRSLKPGNGVMSAVYDLTTARWRIREHIQGGSITRTFAAGNYTASAGNWTVASATTDAYILMGRRLLYMFVVAGTTSGTPVTVSIALPNSVTSAPSQATPYYISNQGGGLSEAGYAQTTVGGTTMGLQRLGNTAFAAGTVSVLGQMEVELQ